MANEQKMAEGILAALGGEGNIRRIGHCMTRLRILLSDDTKANFDQLKQVDGVMGVVPDETIQIVIGPGTVNRVADELSQLTGLGIGEESETEVDDLTFEEKAYIIKDNIKQNKNSTFNIYLHIIGNIF